MGQATPIPGHIEVQLVEPGGGERGEERTGQGESAAVTEGGHRVRFLACGFLPGRKKIISFPAPFAMGQDNSTIRRIVHVSADPPRIDWSPELASWLQ